MATDGGRRRMNDAQATGRGGGAPRRRGTEADGGVRADRRRRERGAVMATAWRGSGATADGGRRGADDGAVVNGGRARGRGWWPASRARSWMAARLGDGSTGTGTATAWWSQGRRRQRGGRDSTGMGTADGVDDDGDGADGDGGRGRKHERGRARTAALSWTATGGHRR